MTRNPRSGQVLVVAAGAVLVLGIIAALTVDAGNAYVARSRLQNAADAAALAATNVLIEKRQLGSEATAREQATCEAGKLVCANWDARPRSP